MDAWMAGDWLQNAGVWIWVAAPLVMMVVAVLPFPAEAPAMLNGALFGPVAGTALTWAGATAGAWLSFELARRLGRPVAGRIVGSSRLARADDLATRAGWGGLLTARFIPLVAFTALNWGAGLTSVPRWRFLWTTALGILPGCIIFTASGSGLAIALERLGPGAAVAGAVALVGFLIWRRHVSMERDRSGAAEP